jgi:hypothetical protein
VRNSPLRKQIDDHWCHDIAHDVLRIEAALRSHQIDKGETTHSQNNGEHDLFCADLSPRPFWRLCPIDVPLRGVLILKDEPTLVTCDDGGEFIRRHAL